MLTRLDKQQPGPFTQAAAGGDFFYREKKLPKGPQSQPATTYSRLVRCKDFAWEAASGDTSTKQPLRDEGTLPSARRFYSSYSPTRASRRRASIRLPSDHLHGQLCNMRVTLLDAHICSKMRSSDGSQGFRTALSSTRTHDATSARSFAANLTRVTFGRKRRCSC